MNKKWWVLLAFMFVSVYSVYSSDICSNLSYQQCISPQYSNVCTPFNVSTYVNQYNSTACNNLGIFIPPTPCNQGDVTLSYNPVSILTCTNNSVFPNQYFYYTNVNTSYTCKTATSCKLNCSEYEDVCSVNGVLTCVNTFNNVRACGSSCTDCTMSVFGSLAFCNISVCGYNESISALCSDNIDNDFDGLIDMDDPGCISICPDFKGFLKSNPSAKNGTDGCCGDDNDLTCIILPSEEYYDSFMACVDGLEENLYFSSSKYCNGNYYGRSRNSNRVFLTSENPTRVENVTIRDINGNCIHLSFARYLYKAQNFYGYNNPASNYNTDYNSNIYYSGQNFICSIDSIGRWRWSGNPVCGDNVIDPGEECDNGINNFGTINPWNINFGKTCLSNCKYNKCYFNTSFINEETVWHNVPNPVPDKNCLDNYNSLPNFENIIFKSTYSNVIGECTYKRLKIDATGYLYLSEEPGISMYYLVNVSPLKNGIGKVWVDTDKTFYRYKRCSDNIDNDYDGLIDMSDPGCSSPSDDTEFTPLSSPQYVCGDGIIGIPGWDNRNCYGVNEQCDFNLTSNSWMVRSCNSINSSFSSGFASCIPGSCSWNLSACSRCGNGVIDPGEQCDGSNFGGLTCTNFSFSGGTLSCNSNCQFNTSNCIHFVNSVNYVTGNGCFNNTCGSNSSISIVITFNSSVNNPNTVFNTRLISQPGLYDCSLNYIFSSVNGSSFNNNKTWVFSGFITEDTIYSYYCHRRILNYTDNNYIRENNVLRSNIFSGYTNRIKLSDCGDGQIDTTLSNPYFNEQCDFNITSNSWMTRSCNSINSSFTGGIASCNPISCKWNMNSCFRCGDGVVNPGEQCDDGNTNNFDTCNNSCMITFCGNNFTDWPNGLFSGGLLGTYCDSNNNCIDDVYGFEECDDGNLNNNDRCANNCVKTFCGDGIIQWPNGRLSGGLLREWSPDGEILTFDYGFEECDDGVNNRLNGTCNNCVKTFCGDGIIQRPNGRLSGGLLGTYCDSNNNCIDDVYGFEECDDGNLNNNDRCANNCVKTFCGDGIIQWPNGNNQFETCEPLLNGSKCDPTTCRFGVCGDGTVQDGEECDNGGRCTLNSNIVCFSDTDCTETYPSFGVCDFDYPDGCSSYCTINDCTIDYVKINPVCENGNVCGAGEVLNVDVGFYGPNCDLVNLVQTDYRPRGDPLCMIQYAPLQGQLKGITYRGSIDGGILSYDYVIPNITEQCAGQTLSVTDTAFYQSNRDDDWIQRSSNILTVDNAEIVFDRCRQFGSVEPYYNYGVYGFDVITNSLTNCYYMTCVDNNAFNVRTFVDDDKKVGVSLIDRFGVSRNFYCDANFEDYVCPDDFEYLGSCRQGRSEGGVCVDNKKFDVDCSVKTLMKCGSVRLINGSIVKACNVPNPVPAKFCYNPNDCVYANESSGLNPVCVGFNSSVNNSINKPIVCSLQNTFCPDGYVFNGSFCVKNAFDCNVNCSNVIDVVKFVSNASLLKVRPEWYNYLNNSGCFLTNNNTGRRFSYCGLKYVWPELVYNYMPVGVVYYRFDWDTGTWQRIG